MKIHLSLWALARSRTGNAVSLGLYMRVYSIYKIRMIFVHFWVIDTSILVVSMVSMVADMSSAASGFHKTANRSYTVEQALCESL